MEQSLPWIVQLQSMTHSIQKELIEIFGERVAFHEIERRVCSHDAGNLPMLFAMFLNTMPTAVVQPANANELKLLLELATKCHIPLVPRGAGTAGYGGAVPTRGGIIVDFSRMKSILNIDASECSVTTEPGATWQELENHLQAHSLALKTYPTSAISATVGGWIANGGGAGIGSYQSSYLVDAIIEIQLITPSGVRVLKQGDIGLANGLCGTTGFISKVTLSVRKMTDDKTIAVQFSELGSFLEMVRKANEARLPLWHVGYVSMRHQLLSNQAIIRQTERDEIHNDPINFPTLPGMIEDGIYGIFVGTSDVIESLTKLVARSEARLLDQQAANYLWQERFYPMRQKALGPSIIPGEVIIPTAKLPGLVGNIKKKLGGDFSLEGTLVNHGKEASALFIFLDDERRPGFTLAYSKSLTIVSEAKKLGGKAYAAGMLLTKEAADLWSEEHLRQVYNFKQTVDPDNIMNPGKVFPVSLDKGSPIRIIEIFSGLTSTFSWLIRSIDKILWHASHRQKRQPSNYDIGWDAYACTSCGYCRTVCTEFQVFGWESASPRGKFTFLRNHLKGKSNPDQRISDMFFMCATCRRCDIICQARIPILKHWDLSMRPALWNSGYELPIFHNDTTENVINEHNPMGHPHIQRTNFLAPDIRHQDKGEIAYWVGCTASYSMIQLAENPLRILNAGGLEPVLFLEDEWCCGSDIILYGRMENIMRTIEHNIKAINNSGVKTLITHCPGCWAAFSLYYPALAQKLKMEWNISVEHITQTIANLIKTGKIELKTPTNLKVTYHDPCHLGRRGSIYEPARQILAAIPQLELVEMFQNKVNAPCCGRQLFQYTAEGPKPYVDRVKEAVGVDASALVTNCPGCQVAYILGIRDAGVENLECLDITDLVCSSMGIPIIPNKIISRMARQGYEQAVKPKINDDITRSSALFAPHANKYRPLPGKRLE